MKISLSIPKPCHEPWQEMKRESTGRFCESCQHTVMDLTKASDAELVRLFTSDTRPKCARFDPKQLERALGNDPPMNRVIPTVAFGSLLAMLASERAAAQQGVVIPDPRPQVAQPEPPPRIMLGEMVIRQIEPEVKCAPLPITGDTVLTEVRDLPLVGDVTIQEPEAVQQVEVITGGLPDDLRLPPESHYYIDGERVVTYPKVEAPELPFIEGRIVDEATQEALPFVGVSIEGTSLGCMTDLDGFFHLALPDSLRESDLKLRLGYLGYETGMYIARPIEVPSAPRSIPAFAAMDPRTISGFIQDPSSGRMVEGASVRIDRTSITDLTDANGFFTLRVPDDFIGKEVHVIATGHDSSLDEATVEVDKLPVSIPMELPASNDPSPTPKISKDGLVLVMRADPGLMMMGGAVSIAYVDTSITGRMKSGFRRAGYWLSGLIR